MNPHAIHRFWAVMICQCGFIDYNKCTSVGLDVSCGAVCACVGTDSR